MSNPLAFSPRRFYLRRLIVACAAALALALVGCGGASMPTQPDRVLLQGEPETPALQAITTLTPLAAAAADIQDGIVMTKIDVRLAPGATVGQINTALQQVNGSIASMRAGSPAITVRVPRAASVEALRQVANTLAAAPGIAFAHIGRTAKPDLLPPSPAGDPDSRDLLRHLLPTRFPAAWNASSLATQGCEQRKVPVLVVDHLPPKPFELDLNFNRELPGFRVIDGDEGIADELHGFIVATVLGANFDSQSPTGANPFTQCLDVAAVNVAGLTYNEQIQRIVAHFPSGKFIANRSMGFRSECPADGCTPDNVRDWFNAPIEIATIAIDWIAGTAPRWDDFMIVNAAGNSRGEVAGAIYPGLAVAKYSSHVSVSADPDLLAQPTPFAFAKDPVLWKPDTTQYPGFPSLAATDDEMQRLAHYAQLTLPSGATPAPNVLTVGSVTWGSTARPLVQSDFSEDGADVHAVGEQVFSLFKNASGTSVSAPQVAGLASYLWLLSPELRALPAWRTRWAILGNTQFSDSGAEILDAYAAALSLDRAEAPTPQSAPVRLAILDLDKNGRFDEADLEQFVAIYWDPDTGDPREVENRNYQPWDLNGDGFGAGATRRERFDLDRQGSTQFGTTVYSKVTQQIEGQAITFDERAVTDMDVLCYYAYSGLYTGSNAERKRLLGIRCAPAKGRLPTTGQIQCYGFLPEGTQGNELNNTTPCAGTGQDGETRVGVAWPEPRFIVDGECVTDRLTGLMWWLPPGQTGPGGFDLVRARWQESIDYLKTLNACGFADWRLPNLRETDSMIDMGWFPPHDKLPHHREYYWLTSQIGPRWQYGLSVLSSTAGGVGGRFAWDFSRAGGVPFGGGSNGTLVPVRTVSLNAPAPLPRTGQVLCYDGQGSVIDCAGTGQDGDALAGTPWPSPRFVVGASDQSECVRDELTGLTWMRSPPTTHFSWLEALDMANQLQLCGHTDWRLPNLLEMMSLRHDGQPDQALWLASQGFVLSNEVLAYWTSTSTTAAQTSWTCTAAFTFTLVKPTWGVGCKANSRWPGSGFDISYGLAWPVRGGTTGSSNDSTRRR